ncbi:MAG: transcriptional regulator, Crp/Fnr family [Phenylobacterium sp.]|nr:transcriptional regulator, Crp/Fnr family [Phenylobacterium sp.]
MAMMMVGLRPNIGNLLLDSLSVSDFDLIKSHLVEVYLGHHEVICEAWAKVETVCFPTEAVLSVITLMKDGRGVEACTIGHESAHGLLNALGAATATDRVIAQIPGAAVRMASAHLKVAAANSSTLTDAVVRHIQANVAQTQQSVACNALHHVEARLCRWLLMSQDRTKDGKLPLTQEFLGFMLGVSRTTVTVAARALQSAGLIDYVRGQIAVLDRDGLEEGSCECYAAVREKQAQLLGHT